MKWKLFIILGNVGFHRVKTKGKTPWVFDVCRIDPFAGTGSTTEAGTSGKRDEMVSLLKQVRDIAENKTSALGSVLFFRCWRNSSAGS